jgi:hypothetical protein
MIAVLLSRFKLLRTDRFVDRESRNHLELTALRQAFDTRRVFIIPIS